MNLFTFLMILSEILNSYCKLSGSLLTQTRRSLKCDTRPEQQDYRIYKVDNDGTRLGDVMPYYDLESDIFYIYYLKDIWIDSTNQRHPWHGFKTNNFLTYQQLDEIISCSAYACDQDFAVGSGSILKRGQVYYAFYTGHNPNYPSSCVKTKEGIMLATSNVPNQKFIKQFNFTTIFAPIHQDFDGQDNFRDPFVFDDNGKYYMLVAARKNVNGIWRGVIIKYISTNLLNWSYDGILFDGGEMIHFMMETPEIFKIGQYYYLIYSDIDSKYLYYRKSTSIDNIWHSPTSNNRFEGIGLYAAKTTADSGGNRYIIGWTNALKGNNDDGKALWGGNMVVHALSQNSNADLTVSLPNSIRSYMEQKHFPLVKHSQWGTVLCTTCDTHSYNLVSTSVMDISNVIFEPVNLDRYKISATVSYSHSAKDFGFMVGACDGYNDFYSLRFIPSQNRLSFDKVKRANLEAFVDAINDVPIHLSPDTYYSIDIVIEYSMVIVYINTVGVALSNRIYKMTNTNWGVFVDNSNATFHNIVVHHPKD
ncbi:unnamed protein product [Didymodactylos carnosus]|uniref:beta-fructofuranosidase n=1 Tax=Didymodactylos carnosus TaxID=1234261 RepID=A0A814UJ76_9BILA|nr:unnamed protein product [Didymodactylos carnosus]CAF1175406.1 unnamed protein product [Didymodactylos carnosus]CAF3592611.1 unnamed protein product [Didymodactylos carnosus]CAF3939353.1 unnamed protein product [Didymodactylos carnosus]